MKKIKEYMYFIGFIGVSLAGVMIFVLIPFADVVRRSFMTVMSGEFAGLNNYKTVVNNQAFRLAVKNTLHFVGVAIPLLVVIGLAAALVLSKIRDIHVIKSLYLFPLAMPTATVVIVWRMFFYRQDFDSLVVSYLWKNTGYTIFVKLPCLKGSVYTIVILSFLNSMKIYREAYLVGGSYPNKDIYLLQHTFNNWYVNLEFDKMAAASVLVAVVLFVFILLFQYYSQR